MYTLKMARRMLLETDKRLLWKLVWNLGVRGSMSVLRHRSRMKKGVFFPPFLYVSIINSCNLRCQGCWVDVAAKQEIIEPAAFHKMVREAQAMGNVFFGSVGAIVLRIVFCAIIGYLLSVPYLKLVGGALLLWIGIKLLLPQHDDGKEIEPADNLFGAIKTIVIADAVMSLDNVIGIAGAAYLQRPDSSGLPSVGTDVKIADDDGSELPRGQVGELWISGPNNVRGYWNKPEATAKAFVGEWFRTGDAGYMDDEGYVYVVDRIKDMVLRGGENVYCVEVESALFEHDAVLDCSVFGLPHDRLGEEVAAVIVPAAGHGPADQDSVVEHMRARLAPFKVPSRWFWRGTEIPRNATGKVLKKDLRDEYSK